MSRGSWLWDVQCVVLHGVWRLWGLQTLTALSRVLLPARSAQKNLARARLRGLENLEAGGDDCLEDPGFGRLLQCLEAPGSSRFRVVGGAGEYA